MHNNKLKINKHQQSLIDYYMPNSEVIAGLSEFFSVFSDPTRVKILSALSITEMCVTDISLMLNLQQSTVSHQLKFLKLFKMVKNRKVGKTVFYSISSKFIEEALNT
ncbi:MAG: ArsR family transcriptional regulator, partial [Clostridia bacterium]|nr:ArsR family transcriptional regulator [Clostridia bacterium]